MILLDTHTFVWLASDLERLSAKAVACRKKNPEHLYISAITGLEICLLVKRGRLLLPMAPVEYLKKALKQHGIKEIPVDTSLACLSAELPGIHNDPFDRLLVATALSRGLTILTLDQTLPLYPGVSTVWA